MDYQDNRVDSIVGGKLEPVSFPFPDHLKDSERTNMLLRELLLLDSRDGIAYTQT